MYYLDTSVPIPRLQYYCRRLSACGHCLDLSNPFKRLLQYGISDLLQYLPPGRKSGKTRSPIGASCLPV
jgi:hypothetical protein